MTRRAIAASPIRHRHFIAAAPRIARAFQASGAHDSSPMIVAQDDPGAAFWALNDACTAAAGAIIATRPEGVGMWEATGIARDALAGGLDPVTGRRAEAGR